MNTIATALANHQSWRTACALAGIKAGTAREWLEKGANDQPRADGKSPTFAEFHAKVEEAMAMSAGHLVQRMDKASEAGSEKATQFLLERRHKEDWGPPQRDEGHGSTERPVQVVLVWPGSGINDRDSEITKAQPIKLEIEAPDEIDDAVVVEPSPAPSVPGDGGPPDRG